MSVAETAKLVTELSLKDQLSPGMAKAKGEVASYDKAATKAATSTGYLTKAHIGAGNAMTHFKQKAGDLTKMIGAAGLLGGVGALVVGIKHGVDAAAQWGVTTDRLHQLTGASIKDASQFADAYDKLGVSQDKQIRIMGFLSKTLGNYNLNRKQAKQVEKDYGFSLLDNNGHMKNALQITQDFTGYFNNKHIPSYQKASLGAKLFGRGWTDMIPVFQKGKKAMSEAMGGAMSMTPTQVKQLHDWRDAQQELNDTVGDLSVKIGLAAIPALTELSRGVNDFVSKHDADIRDLFAKGLQMAKSFAGFIANDVAPNLMKLGQAAVGFWNAIPGPLRDMIATGFVADRAVKFLFGFSPAGLAGSLVKDVLGKGLKGLLGGMMDRGSRTNPMHVVADGGIGGATGGATGKGLGMLGKAALAVEIVGMAAAVWDAWQTNIVQPVAAAQKDNEAKAQGILHDPTSKTRNDLTNMSRLLSEQGATRVVIDTTSAKEIQDALVNAGQNLVNKRGTDSKADIATNIERLKEAQVKATEHGWTSTADALGHDIDVLSGKVVDVKQEVAKTGDRQRKVTQAEHNAYKAAAHANQILQHQGNRIFKGEVTKLQGLMKDGIMGDHYNSSKIREAVHVAERLQVQALRAGHTKLATNLGNDITRMKALLAQRAAAGNAKLNVIANKDTSVKVVTNVTSQIGIRSLESAQSVVSRYGRQAAF